MSAREDQLEDLNSTTFQIKNWLLMNEWLKQNWNYFSLK